jgi:hypothetical protein
MPSVGQAGAGNTAGVLDYCIKNKYLGSGSASSVKDSLLGKVSGQSNDSGYREGSSGMLQTGNGQGYSLGGDGIKAQITQKSATNCFNTRSRFCKRLARSLIQSRSKVPTRGP